MTACNQYRTSTFLNFRNFLGHLFKHVLINLQGVVASGIAFAVQIWCIDRGGPVFVAVYQPVQTFVVAIMASIALGEEFYLGGLVLILITILFF